MPIEYDKKAARYRDGRGRFISPPQIRKQVEKMIEIVGKDFRAVADKLAKKQISTGEWRSRMKEKIKTSNTLAAAAGRGGWRQMSKSDWGKVGAKIKKEYKFLNGFAAEVKAGKVGKSQLAHRSSLYARSARTSFAEANKAANKEAGKTLSRRVRHASESCPDCSSWAGRGFIPADEQPPIGSLTCRANCRCEIEYK